MIDLENTISNLETNIRWIESTECHQFPGWGNVTMAMRDALELLKEQEAVEPDVDSEGTCSCGNCGENVGWYPAGCKTPVRLGKFCSNCGQEVKWE